MSWRTGRNRRFTREGPTSCRHEGVGLLIGMIGTAHQRTGLDHANAEAKTELLPVRKFLGRDPAIHGQMLRGGTEVLADGEDVELLRGHVAEGGGDLGFLFANAEHDARFDDETGGLGAAQELERALVLRLRADGLLQAGYGLDVVVENVGLGVEDGLEVLPAAFEIGDEDFDGGPGTCFMRGANGGGPDSGATVEELVARDGSDDRVLEAHEANRLGDATRLVVVKLGWAAGLHGTKAAAARADVAEDHDGGRFARPAFAEIRALGAFANGMELALVDELGGLLVNRPAGDFCAEPCGLARIERERLLGGRGRFGEIFHESRQFKQALGLCPSSLRMRWESAQSQLSPISLK